MYIFQEYEYTPGMDDKCENCDQVAREFVKNNPSGGSFSLTDMMCEVHKDIAIKSGKHNPIKVDVAVSVLTKRTHFATMQVG